MGIEPNLRKDILKYFPVKVLPAINGIVTIFILTRVLSVNSYFDYVFIIAIVLLYIQIASGWINSSVLYYYPDYETKESLEVLKINTIALQLIILLITSIGFFINAYIGIKNLSIIAITFLLFVSQSFISLLYSFIQAERRIFIQIKSTFIQSFIQLAGVLVCYYQFKNNLLVIFLVLFISYFIAMIYVIVEENIIGLITNFSNYRLIDVSILKELLFYGFPICIWFFSSQFYSIGDRILFKYLNVESLVVNYASFRDLLIGISGFFTMPLLLATHPIIIQLWKYGQNKKKIENILSNNIKLLIALFAQIFIGIVLFGNEILAQLLGEKYLLDDFLMLIVVLTIFLAAVSMYLHKGIESTERTVVMAKIALLVAIISLSLNFFAISRYGVYGASVVSLLSQFLYCILIYRKSRCIFKISISPRFIFNVFVLAILAFFLDINLNCYRFELYLKILFYVFSSYYLFKNLYIKNIKTLGLT